MLGGARKLHHHDRPVFFESSLEALEDFLFIAFHIDLYNVNTLELHIGNVPVGGADGKLFGRSVFVVFLAGVLTKKRAKTKIVADCFLVRDAFICIAEPDGVYVYVVNTIFSDALADDRYKLGERLKGMDFGRDRREEKRVVAGIRSHVENHGSCIKEAAQQLQIFFFIGTVKIGRPIDVIIQISPVRIAEKRDHKRTVARFEFLEHPETDPQPKPIACSDKAEYGAIQVLYVHASFVPNRTGTTK